MHAVEEHVPCQASHRAAQERMMNSCRLSYHSLKLGCADPRCGVPEGIWKSHGELWGAPQLACTSSTQNSSRNTDVVLFHWEPSKCGNSTTFAVKAGARLQQGPATKVAKNKAVMSKEHCTGSAETSRHHCELLHTTAPEIQWWNLSFVISIILPNIHFVQSAFPMRFCLML